ncbi:peptidase M48 [Leptospira idonii]|uniref:Peptidase M48 n=1 Tax=Leptospira idonii TaxID=1193500 RepID=A0A4R9M135_9LEPT|nr:peptidase M48 [Leptospira idonii]
MKRSLLLFFLFVCCFFETFAKGLFYVQSPKAKLLAQPQLTAEGSPLNLGESLTPMDEQGLFVQVRHEDKTGWVSKLFISPIPPGSKIKLGVSSKSSEAVTARQRASDFTKTAAARGLSETEKMRVRGGADLYDFESLRWLESVGDVSNQPNQYNSVTKQSNKTNASTETTVPSSEPVSEETKKEVKIGRALAARLIQKYGLVQNEEFTRYLNRLGNKIASVSSRSELSFRFGILNSNEINAYACPGGFIFITKGSLAKIQSESELAGVLGHEIGHIALFHSGKFPSENVFLEIISSMLAPSGGEVISAAASATLDELEKQLYETGRDASQEWDADEAGVSLASEWGYTPQALGNYLARIAKDEHSKHLTSTHPDTSSRIAKLVKAEAGAAVKGVIPPKEEWTQMKKLIP